MAAMSCDADRGPCYQSACPNCQEIRGIVAQKGTPMTIPPIPDNALRDLYEKIQRLSHKIALAQASAGPTNSTIQATTEPAQAPCRHPRRHAPGCECAALTRRRIVDGDCMIDRASSRACERGTKGCVVVHDPKNIQRAP